MKGSGIALLAVGIAGAFFLYEKEKGSSAQPAPAPQPQPLPGGGVVVPPIPIPTTPSGHGVPVGKDLGCPVESNIPPDVMAVYNAVHTLAGGIVDRSAWEMAATQISAMGYPLLAACLLSQAPGTAGPADPPTF